VATLRKGESNIPAGAAERTTGSSRRATVRYLGISITLLSRAVVAKLTGASTALRRCPIMTPGTALLAVPFEAISGDLASLPTADCMTVLCSAASHGVALD
jgi:hypothetical protein